MNLHGISPPGQWKKKTGSIIVTTPHTLAVRDAVRGINMFRKVGTPLLGAVQNMSTFACPCCGTTTPIFGDAARARAVCADHGLEVLADLPIQQPVADDAHAGRPTVVADPDGEAAAAFMSVARRVAEKIEL